MKSRTITLQEVLKSVCEYYDVTAEQVISRNRKQDFIRPRHMYYHLAYSLTGRSFFQVGHFVERDHASVLYGHNKIRVQSELYKDIHQELDDLKNIIRPSFPLEITEVNLLEICEFNAKSEFLKVG